MAGAQLAGELNASPADRHNSPPLLTTSCQFVSWAIFLFGSGYLVATRRQRNELWLGWLSVVMYCLHQSEEHAYDLRGWRYSFVPSFNTGPLSVMFEETCAKVETSCPLDPKVRQLVVAANAVTCCLISPRLHTNPTHVIPMKGCPLRQCYRGLG